MMSFVVINVSCLLQKKLVQPSAVVSPLTDTTIIRDGSLVYGLPQTILSISVEMERTIDKPGPYWKYAGDLLGLQDVIKIEEENWTITAITVKTYEELDPSAFYVIESNTTFQTNVLALKKEGFVLDLNPSGNNSERSTIGNKDYFAGHAWPYDLGSDEYYQVQSDTAYKRVSIDSSFVRIPYLVEKKKRLTVDQLAEKAAKRLMELREGKILILTGEANVFPQNEAALNEINRLEKDYSELFTGKSWKENRSYTFQINPKKEMAGKPFVLFMFSELTGPSTGSEKGGLPVTVELILEQKLRELTIIKKQEADPLITGFDKLYFRIPDVATLKINKGNETLFNSRKLIYQFGELMQLPANYIIGK